MKLKIGDEIILVKPIHSSDITNIIYKVRNIVSFKESIPDYECLSTCSKEISIDDSELKKGYAVKNNKLNRLIYKIKE